MISFARVKTAYELSRPDYSSLFYQDVVRLVPSTTKTGPVHMWDCACGPTAAVALGLASAWRALSCLPRELVLHVSDRDRDFVIAAQRKFNSSGADVLSGIQSEFTCARAELGPLSLNQGDALSLICVGNAVHWFDLDSFYNTVARRANDSAALVVWTHRLEPFVAENKVLEGALWELNRHLRRLEDPRSRRYVTGGYGNLPFPFEQQIYLPSRIISTDMDLKTVAAYYASIFALASSELQKEKFCSFVINRLAPLWGDQARPARLTWHLDFRAAHVGSYTGPR